MSAEVELIQLLTPEGERIEHPEYAFTGDDEQIKSFYRDMLLVRRIDNEAIALQRQGGTGLRSRQRGERAPGAGVTGPVAVPAGPGGRADRLRPRHVPAGLRLPDLP